MSAMMSEQGQALAGATVRPVLVVVTVVLALCLVAIYLRHR